MNPTHRFDQWMYRGGRPNRLARAVNSAGARLTAVGVAPTRMVNLEVPGRRSGRLVTVPLVVVHYGGERYLVSMLGPDVNWVRNVRAGGGRAVLRHGAPERVRLEEVELGERAPILQRYLDLAPGARAHVAARRGAPLNEFAAIAATYPVFRVISLDPIPVRRPRPSGKQLAQEVGAVVADLPRFVMAPLHRRDHLRWGATDEEVGAAMPGDELIPEPHYCATRAITIDAPPAAVWPWLVQVGCLRAGFYADDLLDNLGHPSAAEILPEFQELKVGQWVPMSPHPTDITAFRVAGFEENRSLLWRQPQSTWSWTLEETEFGQTRLVTRLRIRPDWRNPALATLSVVLNEFGDYPMMRRMLIGIRTRAEHAEFQHLLHSGPANG